MKSVFSHASTTCVMRAKTDMRLIDIFSIINYATASTTATMD